MENYLPGDITTLVVKRVIETGYVLTASDREALEVLMHENEAGENKLVEGDEVEVYLYHDKQKQLIATTTLPHITTDVFDWAEVTEVKPGLGVFVDIGTSKHVLVSYDDLPEHMSAWPTIGDMLYVTLKHDKNNRLLADPVTEADFEGNWDLATDELFNQDIAGRVFRSGKEGAVVITDDGYRGFIHHSERKREPRIGEWVEGRVIKVKPDGSLNMSLLPRKQEAQEVDAEKLYNYMSAHDGMMPFTNKTDPELLRATFDMSKAAFKRAIGKLLKDRLIILEEDRIILANSENSPS
ncbi:hypothetical protein GCM10012290_06120 [Halolactibacillus alkaliphilus]|uniref:S1 motif domain-containing protein n=1 Tax=Halolactibacillus alkaliphilus TaxID=442899 RepID=A0A511WZW2_9BACI|nr:S1-like domain-containing RNA-binding protein [Halolactibacillus alkaliphilus]GEN56234.1 hypothetical protein HAL01_06980 [Halolactibacillus alkaliphilus]GGN66457.1 hypothetical protein GCM10012290_06120 [Halolactibacillus alkaliphilus]SFO67654.1 hypothetical protein SAMN05720591_10473 [Halolactibacillus alkaliphilus]